MIFQLVAELLLVIHLVFICFVVVGGFLLVRWRWLIYIHVPAAVWAALLELNGWLCPLTTLENQYRKMAGQKGYSGGFIEHYIQPVIYPSGLTREDQLILGIIVIACNIVAYGWLAVSILRSRQRASEESL